MPKPTDLQPQSYWSTILFRRVWGDATVEHSGIIEHLYERKAEQDTNIDSGIAPTMKSAEGLYEGTLDLFETTEHAGLKRLIGFIDESVRQAVALINGREYRPEQIEVTFKDSWYHITNNGGFHDAHVHSGCSWCGIYYIQAGDSATEYSEAGAGNGVSRFYCPLATGALQGDYGLNFMKRSTVDIPPRDGTLILFPAYLLHSGLPYQGEQDRILLAFNTTTTVNV